MLRLDCCNFSSEILFPTSFDLSRICRPRECLDTHHTSWWRVHSRRDDIVLQHPTAIYDTMTEILGTAASLAGLLGLCGQILQGCLFLRDLIEGARDAPEDVRLLLSELEILSTAVNSTKDVFEQTSQWSLAINVNAYEAALKHCLELFSTLTTRVMGDSNALNSGSRLNWWRQMGIASRKKTLESLMVRLERAKTQILLIQHNLSL
jgi:hypothetical protein